MVLMVTYAVLIVLSMEYCLLICDGILYCAFYGTFGVALHSMVFFVENYVELLNDVPMVSVLVHSLVHLMANS